MPLIEVKDMCFHYNEAEPILQHMDIRMDSQSTAIVGRYSSMDRIWHP